MSHVLNDLAASTLFGVALNYKGLLDSRLPEFRQPPYQKPPVKPVLFAKAPDTHGKRNAPVLFLRSVEYLQPDPVLGVVVARDASRVKEEEVMAHVAGYMIINELGLLEDSHYRPAVEAKCRNGFCPLSPQLVPMQKIADPHALGLKLYTNSELRQRSSTANLVRDIPQLIAEINESMTLRAGDVLTAGAPEGRINVHPGDRVEVEVNGLGRLVNNIVAE